jgi:FkbM family methyltransferase
MISRLRSWLRKTGLVSLIKPAVSWAERYRLARICDYTVEESGPNEVVFNFEGRRIALRALTMHFKHMAHSEHERPTTAVFLRYVRPGDTVWDVGANVGYYTCLLAELTGDRGEIAAFEPNSHNFRVLQHNIGQLKLLNVQLFRTALADYEGEAQMENADKVASESRLLVPDAPSVGVANVVPVTTGDAALKDHGAPMPDFIKIDVEGFEYEVLCGLKTVLGHPRCRKLLCEVHFTLLERRGKTAAGIKIIALLREAGFNIVNWVSRSHLLALKK